MITIEPAPRDWAFCDLCLDAYLVPQDPNGDVIVTRNNGTGSECFTILCANHAEVSDFEMIDMPWGKGGSLQQ